MKRFTTLALLVFALAAVPAALADDGTTPPAPSSAAAAQQQARGGGNARTRIEILRLRMQIVQLRFRLHCGKGGHASQERCKAFVQKIEDRLTKLDRNVQAKLDELKSCTPASTDPKCANAERKIAALTKLDEHLQNAIKRLQSWLDGTTSTDPSSDSALDQAASQLGQLAGSNG
jgi:hypothetical protein